LWGLLSSSRFNALVHPIWDCDLKLSGIHSVKIEDLNEIEKQANGLQSDK
jgi:hypothetical protein